LEKINNSIQQVIDLQVQLLKVLANPIRLKIIYILKDGEELPVSDLRKELNISKANLSQHITILKNADIVSVVQKGRYSFVYLKATGLMEACSIMKNMIKERFISNANSFLEED
jgi:ArsR family transcriptional regulator, virulence genes transcriptional regulator